MSGLAILAVARLVQESLLIGATRRVRHPLSPSVIGRGSLREPGRFHDLTEWTLLQLRRDRGKEVGPVDHGVRMLGSPSLLCRPCCRDRLSTAPTDVTGGTVGALATRGVSPQLAGSSAAISLARRGVDDLRPPRQSGWPRQAGPRAPTPESQASLPR